MQSQITISLNFISRNGEFLIRIFQKFETNACTIFLPYGMHIINATDFPSEDGSFCLQNARSPNRLFYIRNSLPAEFFPAVSTFSSPPLVCPWVSDWMALLLPTNFDKLSKEEKAQAQNRAFFTSTTGLNRRQNSPR